MILTKYNSVPASSDFFPWIFVILGVVGVSLGVAALIIGRKVHNNYKGIVIALFVLSIVLFIGALVNGIIGGANPRNTLAYKQVVDGLVDTYPYEYMLPGYDSRYYYYTTYIDGYEYWCHQAEMYALYHHACSWVCLGLGSLGALSGVLAFVIQLLTRKIVSRDNSEVKAKGAEAIADNSEVLFYEKYSQGAIEVRQDYIVLYKNWLPFSCFTSGRVSMIIFINDIQHIEYKGCGWFIGVLGLYFKHFNKPVKVGFGKWFFWRRMAFNYKMQPIYEYLRSRVISNNK